MIPSPSEFVSAHLRSNTPTFEVELPIIGKVPVRCVSKWERKQDIPFLEASLGLDGLGRFLLPADASRLSKAVLDALQLLSPDVDRMTSGELRELRTKLSEGLGWMFLEEFKLGFCETPYQYFGLPLVELSDVRMLLWLEARKKHNDR